MNTLTAEALLESGASDAPRCGDPLRAFRWLVGTKCTAGDYLACALDTASDDMVSAAARDDTGSAVALGRMARFETDILNQPIARLTDIVAWGARSGGDALGRALNAALEALHTRGVRHVIAAAMADDGEIRSALEARGFREIAKKRSYYCSPANRAAVRPINLRHVVRPATDADLDRLRALATRFEFSQYLHVPGVTREAVTRLYESWIERAMRREFASEVLVVEQAGRAAGFFSFKIDETLHTLTGKRLLRHGLTAVEANRPALFSDLILGLQRYVLDGGGDGVQFDFYAENSPVERMFERFCCFPAADVVVYLGASRAGDGR